MEAVVANVDHIKFDIEVALEQQLGAEPLPFSGMDSKIFKMRAFFRKISSSLTDIIL